MLLTLSRVGHFVYSGPVAKLFYGYKKSQLYMILYIIYAKYLIAFTGFPKSIFSKTFQINIHKSLVCSTLQYNKQPVSISSGFQNSFKRKETCWVRNVQHASAS